MSFDNAFKRIASSNCFEYFLLFVVCVSIYSNTSNATWHLYDYANIINNPAIRKSDLLPNSLFRAVGLLHSPDATNTGRPIAFLTFAFNWYAGKDHPAGYHVVNIFLHILCAVILLLFLESLFQTPYLSGCCDGDEQNIALLCAVLWAIHPIQTQAVSYIVQRMTLLAMLFFYISGLLCYVHARIQTERTARFGLFSGCILCLMLAVGSKENAVVFPLSLALIEIVFFETFPWEPIIKQAFS